MKNIGVSSKDIAVIVDLTLAEDIGEGDVTTKVTIGPSRRLKARIVAREDLVVCGLPILNEIFRRLEPNMSIITNHHDSCEVKSGEAIVLVNGYAEGILTAERSVLNALQFFSGISTLTRAYVKAIEGTGVELLDTRKTIPGLRNFSKYAVRCGGGNNHRLRLDDGILIKDNHIWAAGGIREAINLAKSNDKIKLPIQVECDNLWQVEEALDAGADKLLLDNMSLETLKKAAKIIGGRISLEASGGITLTNIRDVAETGVNCISVGAITQKAPAVDIGLDVDESNVC